MVHPTYRKAHLPKNLGKRKSRQSPPKRACRDCKPWQPLKELCEDGVCLSKNPESFNDHEKLILRRENRDVVIGAGQSTYKDKKGKLHNRLEELRDPAPGPLATLSGEAEEEKKRSRAWERRTKKMKRFLRECLADPRLTELQRRVLELIMKGFSLGQMARILKRPMPVVHQIIFGRPGEGKVIGGLTKKLKRLAQERGFGIAEDT